MKRVKLVSIFLSLFTVILCSAFVFTSCDYIGHVHNYSNEWIKDATYHWQSCSWCEEMRYKAEHDWNSGVVTLQPTNTSEGVRTYTCNACGHTRIEGIPVLNTHEHTFSNEWSSNDTHHWHAAVCEHSSEKKDNAEHDWDDGITIKVSTEKEPGIKEYTCQTCEKTKREEIPILQHQHSFTEEVVASKYLFSKATCEESTQYFYSCICGEVGNKTFEYGDPLGHNYTDTITAPTCTEQGYATHTCERCGDSYQNDYKDALGHTEVIDEASSPTCTEIGLTEGVHCSACDEILVAQEIVAALGHSHKSTVTAPTCTEQGYTTYTCHCEDTYIADEIEALGHKYNDGEQTLAPTCTEKGVTTFSCMREGCAATYSTPILPKGHVYKNPEIKIPVSCVHDGYTYYICEICDVEFVEKILALGHNFGEFEEVISPTCNVSGKLIKTCKNEGCLECVTKEINALQHHFECIEETKTQFFYECLYCKEQKTTNKEVVSKKQPYEYNCSNDFVFYIQTNEEEEYIRQNLAILTAYFEGTEYEDDAKYPYILQKTQEDVWLVTATLKYEERMTYFADLTGELEFLDYEGKRLSFTIYGEEKNIIDIKNDILFLQQLEDESSGYYPYNLKWEENSEVYYLTLQKQGIFTEEYIGRNICVGDVRNVGEIINDPSREYYFGKIEMIYTNQLGQCEMVLSCPEIGEIFEDLDIYTEINPDLADFQFSEDLEQQLIDSMYANEDFSMYLVSANEAAAAYASERDWTSENILTKSIKDKIQWNFKTQIKDKKMQLRLGAVLNIPLKDKNGNEVGQINVFINAETEFRAAFQLDWQWKTKKIWFVKIITGIDYFALTFDETTKFSVALGVEIQYKISNIADYYLHTESNKVHRSDCKHIEELRKQNSKVLQKYDYNMVYKNVLDNIFDECDTCKPVTGRDVSSFVVNTDRNTIHTTTCSHIPTIAEENKKYINFFDNQYTKCKDCNPIDQNIEDYKSKFQAGLRHGDWAAKVEEARELINEGTNKTKPVMAKNTSLGHLSVSIYGFNINLDVSFFFEFTFDATIQYEYGIEYNDKYILKYQGGLQFIHESVRKETLNHFEITGKSKVECGLRAGVSIQYNALPWVGGGLTADAGVYAEMAGVVNIDASGDGKNYIAGYAELGIEFEGNAYFKLFGKKWEKRLFQQQIPIIKAGYDRAYYAFNNYCDTPIVINGDSYNLDGAKLLQVNYFDLKKMERKSEVLNFAGGAYYDIDFIFKDKDGNKVDYCKVDGLGRLSVLDSAPCTFEVIMYIELDGTNNITTIAEFFKKGYVKDQAIFYIEAYPITINVTNHHAVMDARVEPTCMSLGWTQGSHCEDCGIILEEQVSLPKVDHLFIEYVSNHDATCTKDGTKTANCKWKCGSTDTLIEEGSMLPHTFVEGVCVCGKLDAKYTATVIYPDGTEKQFTFTKDNMEVVEAQIKAELPADTSVEIYLPYHFSPDFFTDRTYAWDKEVFLQLTDEAGVNVFTIIETMVEYTINIVNDGTLSDSYFATASMLKMMLTNIQSILPSDTAAYNYNISWETNGTVITARLIKTPVKYTAYVVDCDGMGKEYVFTVENMEEVETEIETELPEDEYASIYIPDGCFGGERYSFLAYTYTWAETGTKEVKLSLGNSTWTVVQTAVEYTVTIIDYEGNGISYTLTIETMESMFARIEAMLPVDSAAYTYRWEWETNGTVITVRLIKMPVVYAATVVDYEGNETIYDFTVENMAEVEARIEASLPEDTDDYVYIWEETITEDVPEGSREVTLSLENSTWTMRKLKVFTVFVDGSTVTGYVYHGTYTRLTSLEWINEDVDGVLPEDTDEYIYVWKETGTRHVNITEIGDYSFTMLRLPAPKASEGLEYTLSSDKTYYKVAGIGTCKDTDLVIPSTYEGKPVREIGSFAFYNCTSLTSVVIGNNVTSIGNCAFENCTSLTSVVIGDNVTSIGNDAFSRCTSLTSVVIPDSVTSIGSEAFRYCTSLTSVVIGDSVTSIGSYAFYNCNSLMSVVIPDSVTTIGSYAFYNCYSLTNITVSGGNPNYQSIDGNLYTKDGKTFIQYAIGKTATSFTIPDGVKTIGSDAFYNCTSLTSVVIPNSITAIGNYVFFDCTSLTNVVIGNSVETIGNSAFAYCDSLTSVVIPDSVTTIGSDAFKDCDSLTSIVITDSVTSIGSWVFASCDNLTSVVIGDNATSIGPYAFNYCTNLTSVVIGESVTSIGSYAFFSCDSLMSVVIGDRVTSIGSDVFYNCTNLTSVYYKGTASDWAKISINTWNGNLTNATRYYYSERKPTTSGNYWHYVDGKPTIWE